MLSAFLWPQVFEYIDDRIAEKTSGAAGPEQAIAR
jgi:hypothetical protein